MSIRTFNITVNGVAYEVAVEETTAGAAYVPAAPAAPAPAAPAAPAAPKAAPAPTPAAPAAPAAPKAAGTEGAEKITSPFPGTVVSIAVGVGAAVKKGDILCVVEAMKMENEITAPCDGTVASVNTQKGASVQTGELLLSLN